MAFPWINNDAAAYTPMSRLYSFQGAVLDARNLDNYVYSGCQISAGTTTGTIKMAAGQVFLNQLSSGVEGELILVAQDNIACCANADATNPRFAIVELDNTSTVNLNLGTPAANPEPPTLTSNRVPLALIYIPANATAVDSLTSTANGNAKIIDCRQVVTTHNPYLYATDIATTSLTNPTSLTSLLGSTIPLGSMNSNDTFEITASGFITNNATATTVQFAILLGSVTGMSWTSDSLNTSASVRKFTLKFIVTYKAIITGALASSFGFISAPSGNLEVTLSLGGGANGSAFSGSRTLSGTITGVSLDLQATFGASSTGATIALRQFSMVKYPS